MRIEWFGQSAFRLSRERTPALDSLEPPDELLAHVRGAVERPGASEVEAEPLIGSRDEPVVVVLEAPSH
jgi:hypothetical protein